MAPDAIASIVDSRSAAVGRLENTYQTVGLPLPVQIRPSTIPIVTPLQTRIKPQKRQAKLPSIVYRESDSSLSEYEDFDSDAETERMHTSPKKQRSSMVVQHPSASTVTTASAMVLEIPLEDLSRHIDMSTNDRPLYFPSKSTSKKRKRDENSPLTSLDPLTKKLIMISTSEKKVQSPLGKGAIETFGRNPENKDSALINSRASSPDNAFATGNYISHSQNEWDNADNGEVMTQISDDDVDDIFDKLQSAEEEEDIGNSTDVHDLAKDRQKLKAVEDLVEIEKIFAKLKDSIYNEKLHRVEIEMKLLREGSHPEYVAQKRVIDYRLEEKVRLSNAQYNHAMKSLDISTYVNRAQLHSQYFQQARKLREDTLYHCSELWYNIQRERRVGDAPVPEYTVRISDRQSTRIKQRMQYNWEVQILGGIQKQIGFPAAPDVNGATKGDMDEDFESLGVRCFYFPFP
ncbi:Sds3-like-domain-containing protein [Trichophaea hybrida]|nr:Sds3-like-domain-containing protein [Trichophaea hybrida]